MTFLLHIGVTFTTASYSPFLTCHFTTQNVICDNIQQEKEGGLLLYCRVTVCLCEEGQIVGVGTKDQLHCLSVRASAKVNFWSERD